MPTVISTERDKIRTVAARWKASYPSDRWGKDKQSIGAQLCALDPETVTADQVNAIIGNDTWTSDSCTECGTYSTWSMRIGQEPDYESQTVWLCRACAKRLFSELLPHVEDTPPDFHPV